MEMTKLMTREDVEAVLRDRRTRWGAALVGGAVVALAVGVLATREVQRRHKLPPVRGTYESVKVEGRDLADGTTIRLTFTDDWMDLYAGGNDMTGTVAMNGATMHWSEEDSTGVGCMPNLAVQDAWLTQWLNRGVTLYRDHKRLVLSRDGVKVVFRRLADED
jgi:heat shock protein HslJ